MEWQTTFWMDFTIADRFGINDVKDTFKRAYEEWKDNYVYLTELEIVMNWNCWDIKTLFRLLLQMQELCIQNIHKRAVGLSL